MKTGKLVLRYVGEYGRHTELYIDDELIAAGFNCDKSIMLLIWCLADKLQISVDDILHADFVYSDSPLGTKLCKTIFTPQLFSKYDILACKNAAANAYYNIIYKKKYSIDEVLSAKRDLILHVQKQFKLDNLEVIYELDEDEIYANGRI